MDAPTREAIASIMGDDGQPRYAVWDANGSMIAPVPEFMHHDGRIVVLMTENEREALNSAKVPDDQMQSHQFPELSQPSPFRGWTRLEVLAHQATLMDDETLAQIGDRFGPTWAEIAVAEAKRRNNDE